MINISRHAEWLSLIDISGPFLTVSMLERAFPQGLDAVVTNKRQKMRAAYDEWREAVDEGDNLLSALHLEWIRLVLSEMLEYDHESLIHTSIWKGKIPSISSQEHTGIFTPDWIICCPGDNIPRLFISVLPPNTDFESIQRGDGWPVSLQERMTLLCRENSVRVGVLTDGERWMLVNAPIGSMSSQASWYSRLWFQEPITLKAFQSLLGVRRCFGPEEETLEALLDESLKHQEEVTDTLGEQVRRAVEVLVQCLDKADEDRNRELLQDVKPAELYEAGLTVMMRLVFILCAEERGLLLLGDLTYDQCYAVSTLRGQLAEEADQYGPEILDRRYDAWARLLAIFRAIYGGIEHESLRMPAMGGSLFDPDRFPFLEGRAIGTYWHDTVAAPLPIDNRTVLLLLTSLQILEQSGGALLLSYRALDVEQIGHVYEGLLEHTVARVPYVTLGLHGSQKVKNPNVALVDLESAQMINDDTLVHLLLNITGRSISSIRNGLKKSANEDTVSKVLGVCGGDTILSERIRPFVNLLRSDAWEEPLIYQANSFIVSIGVDRRESGTHYTPKLLTESIVATTLEPVVYIGPAEEKKRDEWTLKSSEGILELMICDPAMGSGAFLVQACRYLSDKLIEPWLHEEATGKMITFDGKACNDIGEQEPMSLQLDERLIIARRLIAERCLYGVDINPLAVELAKLALWLVTLAKGKPFGFLDHNLRSGDSLLGILRLEQLTHLSMTPESGKFQLRITSNRIEEALKDTIELRGRIRTTTIRDIRDVEDMSHLDRDVRQKLKSIKLFADAMIGETLRCGGNARAFETALDSLAFLADDYISGNEKAGEQIVRQAMFSLSIDLPIGKPIRKPFHWALEFPEVYEHGGFDSVIGNPPFLGGKRITTVLGESYTFALRVVVSDTKGAADLSAYFLLRAYSNLRKGGTLGLVLTNSINEGDTREVGLKSIVTHGGNIISAELNKAWSGSANITVSTISINNGPWKGNRDINGISVETINEFLSEQETIDTPYILASNKYIASTGTGINGKGFILSPEECKNILVSDPRNVEVIQPFLTSQDINTRLDSSPSRFVINFKNMSEEDAKQYWLPYKRILDVVKPIRDKLSRQVHEECFWKHWDRRDEFFTLLSGFDRAVVMGRVSKHHAITFMNTKWLPFDGVVVFLWTDNAHFALLQSTIHEIWSTRFRTTLRQDPRYSISDCFLTFALPNQDTLHIEAEQIGKQYYEFRSSIMLQRSEGLTSIYNCFHNPKEHDGDIQELRRLHGLLDSAIVKAYGWDDIENLKYSFTNTNQGIRYTCPEPNRNEILRRLLDLNCQYHKYEMNSIY